MRVLHIYKTYFPETQGGIEQVIRQLARTTTSLGVTTRLITCTHNTAFSQDQDACLTISRYPARITLAQCPMSDAMARAFHQETAWADVLHYHFPWPFADTLHLTVASKRPAVVTYHSDVVRQRVLNVLYQPIARRFLKNVQHIAVGSLPLTQTSPLLSHFQDKTSVIPFGIDEMDYPPVDPTLVERWKTQFGKPFLLFVGVLRYYKGLHVLLDALKGTDITAVIAGSGPCGPALRAQAETLGLSNVHFLGTISETDKCALMQACHAVILPSQLRSEAFGMVLVEGLMFGKPLISTELGTGTSFVNADQETGYVVPVGNIGTLRDAMQRMVHNTEHYSKLCHAARQRYETLFTAQKMGLAYYELYQKIK